MADDGALNIRLPPTVAEGLARIAAHENRTPADVAADTIADLVRRDAEYRAGIERGLADWRAGRVVPHDEAMDRLDRTVAAAAATKRRR